MTEETLGAKLYRLRTERGWTLRQAAEKFGRSEHRQFVEWENEIRHPQLCNVQKLADFYGVPRSYLLPDKTESIPHDDNETIGQRIQRLRIQKGWSHRTDFARAINVSRQMIYDWETGKYNPRADDIAPLAKALGVTTDYLLTGRESPLLAAIKAQIKQGAPRDRLLAMVDYSNAQGRDE